MPPFPGGYRGRDAIGQFLRTVPAGGHLDQFTLAPVTANLRPAVAAYVRDAGGSGSTAYGIMALTIDGDRVAEITGFADPALFAAFGLPWHLE
jgi:RNA polymerase sigma-70 factor (ECF subfamily)